MIIYFIFLFSRILHDSVSTHSILVDDKKYSKDIQEATHKLVEICNNYVASSLQQTTWLRKNYAVKLTNSNGTSSSNSSKQIDEPSLNNENTDEIESNGNFLFKPNYNN